MTKSKTESNKASGKPLESKRTTKGPEPERLKIHGNWKAAVRLAMQKRKPPGGWPK
jgi:hypothetical protein